MRFIVTSCEHETFFVFITFLTTISCRQRDRLEDMLRTVTTNRMKVGELMMWCIDHAEYCEEVIRKFFMQFRQHRHKRSIMDDDLFRKI